MFLVEKMGATLREAFSLTLATVSSNARELARPLQPRGVLAARHDIVVITSVSVVSRAGVNDHRRSRHQE
jgi:hypothetical protein